MRHHYGNWILDRLWKYMLMLGALLLIAAIAIYQFAFNATYVGIFAVTSAGLIGLGLAFKPERFDPKTDAAQKEALRQIVASINDKP